MLVLYQKALKKVAGLHSKYHAPWFYLVTVCWYSKLLHYVLSVTYSKVVLLHNISKEEFIVSAIVKN